MKIDKNKITQWARKVIQFVFVGLLIAGIYMDLRMIIIVFLPATLVFGNFFCGWACPFGTVQEIMSNIGSLFIKKKLKMPRKVQKYLQYFRYVLFVIVIIGVLDFVLTPMNGYGTFLSLFSEEMITVVSWVSLGIMAFYLVLSMFFERAFCNYLCTEAAKYGVLNMTRIFSIKRNEDTCVNCKKCDMACPMNIEVSAHDNVRNGQCINCMKCINECPLKDTLSYKYVGWNLKKKNNK